MNESPVQRALAASTFSLLIGGACLFAFLPPVLFTTLESLPRTVGVGIVLACALLLHWAFLAIGARRMGRSPAGWLALSVLLFPVGSVAALVLLGWYGSEPTHGDLSSGPA